MLNVPWTSLTSVLTAAVMALVAVIGSDTIPTTLAEMANSERAFAKTASGQSIRNAFIEFFADESVNFNPVPGPARQRLKDNPNAFPPGMKMLWEPRLGDVAASGDMGYLTGPTEIAMAGQPARYGNYFSVWKRQANGQYRVILDIGAAQPGKLTFADGFVRSKAVATYKGKDSKATAEASLLAADKAFGSAIASKGASAAYLQTMHEGGRLHRSGYLSMTSGKAAADWMTAHVKAMTSEPGKSEAAASGDLGYTWGSFTMTSSTDQAYKGYYIRVWTRQADGQWKVVADISEPSRP
jgi:ketosteroid isomerase-like protein